MAEFKAEVFQNEYLAEGATDVHGVVSVTCTGAGAAGQSGQGEAAEIIIVDTSGSMDMPPRRSPRPDAPPRWRSTRSSTARGSPWSAATPSRRWCIRRIRAWPR